MVKDSVGKFITQIIVMIISLGVSVILNRSLGADGRGQLQMIILMPQILWILGSLGIDMSNVFFAGREPNRIPKLVSNSIWLGLILGFICIFTIVAGYKVWYSINPAIEKQLLGVPEHLFFMMLFTIPMFLISYFLDSIIYGMDKIHARNIKDIFVNIFFLIITIIIVTRPDAQAPFINRTFGFGLDQGLYGATIVQLMMTGFMVVYSVFLVSKFTKWSLFTFDIAYVGHGLRYIGLYAWGANAATFLFYKVSMLIIAYYIVHLTDLTEADLGNYAVASNICDKIWYVPGSIVYALLPKLTSKTHDAAREITSKASRHTFFITFIIMGFLSLFIKPIIIELFGDEYSNAAAVFWGLAPGVLILSMGKVYGTHLLGIGKPFYAFWFSIITLIVNFILNYYAIPIWGILGSAVSTSIAYTIQTVLLFWAFQRESKTPTSDLLIMKKDDWLVYSRGVTDVWRYISRRNV